MSKTVRWLLFFLGILASPAFGQVSGPPHVFVADTVINPDEVNLNFSTIYNAACNRGGCTMTGALLFSADNTHDIGASGATRPRDLFLGRNAAIGGTIGVTGAATFSAAIGGTTLTLSNTGASALDIGGGMNAGTGNVAIIGTDGRIPDISSTTFASLSGANLTSIPETAITDGSLLARVAAAETISAEWIFSTNPVVSNNAAFLRLRDGNSGSDEKNWLLQSDGSQFTLALSTDASPSTAVTNAIEIQRAGTTITLFDLRTGANVSTTTLSSTGTLTHKFALVLSGIISPTTLSGDADNYNPSGLSTASVVRVITNDTTPRAINGIAGGVDGRAIRWCNIGTSGVNGNISLAGEAGSSTASNRISATTTISIGTCVVTVYDGTSSRWRPEI